MDNQTNLEPIKWAAQWKFDEPQSPLPPAVPDTRRYVCRKIGTFENGFWDDEWYRVNPDGTEERITHVLPVLPSIDLIILNGVILTDDQRQAILDAGEGTEEIS